jgi:hypothetical protein
VESVSEGCPTCALPDVQNARTNAVSVMVCLPQEDQPTLSQQSYHDAQPFRIERLFANGFASAMIPVRRVVLIAFLAVQICVNPRAILAFVLLGGFVRSFPVALGIPPQSGKGECESCWRLGRGE